MRKLFLLFTVFFSFTSLVAIDAAEDFLFVKPPSVTQQTSREVKVMGESIPYFLFQTTLTETELMDYYNKTMKEKGFSVEFADETGKSFSYVKDESAVRIRIIKPPIQTPYSLVMVSISKPCPTCEEKPSPYPSFSPDSGPGGFSLDDIETDAPGEDLEFIPRPEGSIRLLHMSYGKPKATVLMYKCTQSIDELRNFYKQYMDYHYWQLARENSYKELQDTLSKSGIDLQSALEKIPDGAFIKSDFMENSYILTFTGPPGEATIAIMHNPTGKGSLVKIRHKPNKLK